MLRTSTGRRYMIVEKRLKEGDQRRMKLKAIVLSEEEDPCTATFDLKWDSRKRSR